MKSSFVKAGYLWLLCVMPVCMSLQAQETKIFTDPEKIFTARLPLAWQNEMQSKSNKFSLHPVGNNEKKIVLQAEALPNLISDMTLKEWSEGALDELKKDVKKGKAVIHNNDYVTINGTEWFTIDFSDKTTRNIIYLTILDKKKYRFFYTAPLNEYDKNIVTAKAVINSVQFGGSFNNTIPAAAESNTSDNNKTTPRNVFENSKAGTIAPDAIKLEVDELSAFYGKFAVIKKGTNHEALINDKGEIVLPFNKYRFVMFHHLSPYHDEKFHEAEAIGRSFYPYSGYYGSLAQFQNNIKPVKLVQCTDIITGNIGYITVEGKLVFPKNMREFASYDDEGYFGVKPNSSDTSLLSIKYDGTIIKGKGPITITMDKRSGSMSLKENYDFENHKNINIMSRSGWTNGLRPASYIIRGGSQENSNDPAIALSYKNKKVGFINRMGDFKIKPGFYGVCGFSEGLAFVSKIDEFDKIKWGAIDTTGKLVIPYKFSSCPTPFSHGRSLIKASGLDKIEFGVIDKKGDVVFTIPKNSGDTISVEFPFERSNTIEGNYFNSFVFMEGYQLATIEFKAKSGRSGRETFLLDTAGHYTPIERLIENQIPQGQNHVTIIPPIRDGKFIFRYSTSAVNALGMADIKGNILMPPVFSQLYLFEKESSLQYAQYGKAPKISEIGTEGYIDKDGVFKIIKVKEKNGF